MKKLAKKPLKKYINGGDPPTDDGKKGVKYVTDPNRVKAYQDSLNLYNLEQNWIDKTNKEALNTFDVRSNYKAKNQAEYISMIEGPLKDAIKAGDDYFGYKRISNVENKQSVPGKFLSSVDGDVLLKEGSNGEKLYEVKNMDYKKPVQPVKLAKTFGDIDPQPQKKMTEGRHGWMGDPKEATLKGPIKKGASYPRFALPNAMAIDSMRDIYEYDPKLGVYDMKTSMPFEDTRNMDIIHKNTTESMRKDIERFLPGSTKQKPKTTYLTGGQVGSLAGTALSFIPGVGGILNAGANMLGQLYDENNPEKEPVKKATELKQLTENAYGNFSDGGKLKGNARPIPLQVNREATQPDVFKYGVIPAIDHAMNKKLNGYLFSSGVDTDDSVNVTVRGGGLDYKTPIKKDSKLSLKANLGVNKASVFVPGVDEPVYNKFQLVPQVGLSYKFKNGGRVPDNLKALDGGHFKKLASDVYLAKGKTHKAGGIKGDVDNDGQPELELEGNELYFDDAQYIINKDISKQFTNSFSKRGDKVAQNTNDMLKKMAIGANEKLLKTANYKNGGKLPKYVKGGPNLVGQDYLNEIQNGQDFDMDWADPSTFIKPAYTNFMQDPVRNSASIYDPMIDYTNPNAAFAVDNLSFNSLNDVSRANSTGRQFDISHSNDKDNSQNKDGGGGNSEDLLSTDKYKMTAGDYVNIAGQAVAPIYNLARGLFEKSKVETPVLNPYENQIKGLMANRRYNDQTVQNELDYTREAGKTAISENSSSASVRRGNFQNLYSNIGRNKATADLQGQQMNNQYRADEAQTLNSLGAQNVQATNLAKGLNYQNAAAKDAYISTGVSQIGAGASTVAEGMNTVKQNSLLLNLLGNMSNIYTMDENGKITLKKLI